MTPTSIDDTNDMINIQSVNICKARLHLKFGFWFCRHQIEVVDGYSMGELISNKIKGRCKKNGYFTVRLTIRGGPDRKQMWKFYGQPDRKIFVFSSPLNYFEDCISLFQLSRYSYWAWKMQIFYDLWANLLKGDLMAIGWAKAVKESGLT